MQKQKKTRAKLQYGAVGDFNGYADIEGKASKHKCVIGAVITIVVVVIVIGIAVFVGWELRRKKQQTASPQYDMWNTVLQQNVQVGKVDNVTINVVDYCGIKADPTFKQVAESWATASTAGFNQEEFLAFYINAYNIFTIRTIIEHAKLPGGECIKGIRDIGFDLPITVAGSNTSLNKIELTLRNPREYGWDFDEDCRIHGCIVCASVSCPNVRQGAYLPNSQLDSQMSSNVNNWLGSSYKGATVISNELTVSKIFSFFPQDFAKASCQGGVVNFILKYASGLVGTFIQDKRRANATWSEFGFFTKPTQTWGGKSETGYNWNLNGKAPCSCP